MVQLEIKNAIFSAQLDGDLEFTEFADHVDNAALTTTSTATNFAAISGNDQNRVAQPTETIVLNIGQSLKAGSLWLFLRENHGKSGKVEFFPAGGLLPKVSADVTFQAPGSLGGVRGPGVSGATILVNGMAEITPEA
jgi:hypothetical protein